MLVHVLPVTDVHSIGLMLNKMKPFKPSVTFFAGLKEKNRKERQKKKDFAWKKKLVRRRRKENVKKRQLEKRQKRKPGEELRKNKC